MNTKLGTDFTEEDLDDEKTKSSISEEEHKRRVLEEFEASEQKVHQDVYASDSQSKSVVATMFGDTEQYRAYDRLKTITNGFTNPYSTAYYAHKSSVLLQQSVNSNQSEVNKILNSQGYESLVSGGINRQTLNSVIDKISEEKKIDSKELNDSYFYKLKHFEGDNLGLLGITINELSPDLQAEIHSLSQGNNLTDVSNIKDLFDNCYDRTISDFSAATQNMSTLSKALSEKYNVHDINKLSSEKLKEIIDTGKMSGVNLDADTIKLLEEYYKNKQIADASNKKNQKNALAEDFKAKTYKQTDVYQGVHKTKQKINSAIKVGRVIDTAGFATLELSKNILAHTAKVTFHSVNRGQIYLIDRKLKLGTGDKQALQNQKEKLAKFDKKAQDRISRIRERNLHANHKKNKKDRQNKRKEAYTNARDKVTFKSTRLKGKDKINNKKERFKGKLANSKLGRGLGKIFKPAKSITSFLKKANPLNLIKMFKNFIKNAIKKILMSIAGFIISFLGSTVGILILTVLIVVAIGTAFKVDLVEQAYQFTLYTYSNSLGTVALAGSGAADEIFNKYGEYIYMRSQTGAENHDGRQYFFPLSDQNNGNEAGNANKIQYGFETIKNSIIPCTVDSSMVTGAYTDEYQVPTDFNIGMFFRSKELSALAQAGSNLGLLEEIKLFQELLDNVRDDQLDVPVVFALFPKESDSQTTGASFSMDSFVDENEDGYNDNHDSRIYYYSEGMSFCENSTADNPCLAYHHYYHTPAQIAAGKCDNPSSTTTLKYDKIHHYKFVNNDYSNKIGYTLKRYTGSAQGGALTLDIYSYIFNQNNNINSGVGSIDIGTDLGYTWYQCDTPLQSLPLGNENSKLSYDYINDAKGDLYLAYRYIKGEETDLDIGVSALSDILYYKCNLEDPNNPDFSVSTNATGEAENYVKYLLGNHGFADGIESVQFVDMTSLVNSTVGTNAYPLVDVYDNIRVDKAVTTEITLTSDDFNNMSSNDKDFWNYIINTIKMNTDKYIQSTPFVNDNRYIQTNYKVKTLTNNNSNIDYYIIGMKECVANTKTTYIFTVLLGTDATYYKCSTAYSIESDVLCGGHDGCTGHLAHNIKIKQPTMEDVFNAFEQQTNITMDKLLRKDILTLYNEYIQTENYEGSGSIEGIEFSKTPIYFDKNDLEFEFDFYAYFKLPDTSYLYYDKNKDMSYKYIYN